VIAAVVALSLAAAAHAAATRVATTDAAVAGEVAAATAQSGSSGQGSSSQASSARTDEIKKLYDAGEWEEVVRATAEGEGAAADEDFYRGMALAKLQRWSEARVALATGERKAPEDERFPVELAGVAYKLKDFAAAERELRRALRLAPKDAYALNFLASIYFLRGNLEAALEYWNRAGLPRVNEVKEEPEPQVNAELLDRAIAFAPLSTLELRDFETTEARLDGLGIFAFHRWELKPVEGGAENSFDAIFHSVERNGFGGNKWLAALSMLRGLPYETVYPEYDNARHRAVNFDGLLRFDPQKERAFAEVSAPVGGDPRWRARAWVDGRDENWNISESFAGASAPITDLKLRKIEAGAGIRSIESGRWSWETGAAFARRSFRNQTGLETQAAPFFTDGNSLELRASTNYRLLWLPDRRLSLDAGASGTVGRFFAAPLSTYAIGTGALELRWLPQEQGDDYEMRTSLRAGGTGGRVPLDDLFTLGVERDDNDLWLRGISTTHDGRKGNSPMGRDYVLWNWEQDKIVYHGAFFQVRVGPLLDAGKIADPSGLFGSGGWLWDPGAQVKVRVLDTIEVVFSYGHDMRSGQNVFFGATGK